MVNNIFEEQSGLLETKLIPYDYRSMVQIGDDRNSSCRLCWFRHKSDNISRRKHNDRISNRNAFVNDSRGGGSLVRRTRPRGGGLARDENRRRSRNPM